LKRLLSLLAVLAILLIACQATSMPAEAIPQEDEPAIAEAAIEPTPVIEADIEPEPAEDASDADFEPALHDVDSASAPVPPPANQILFGYDWPAAGIDWEVAITNPEHIAQIESFLQDAQPATMDSPLVGGVVQHLDLTLDNQPVRFFVTVNQHPDHTSGRVLIFQYGRDWADSIYTVDWRIWRVLLPYDQSPAVNDANSLAPSLQLVHGQTGVRTLGEMLADAGVSRTDLRQIDIFSEIGRGHRQVQITNPALLAELWETLTELALTPRGAPQRMSWEYDVLNVTLRADDFRVWLPFYTADTEFLLYFGDPPLAIDGQDGTALHAQLSALFTD